MITIWCNEINKDVPIFALDDDQTELPPAENFEPGTTVNLRGSFFMRSMWSEVRIDGRSISSQDWVPLSNLCFEWSTHETRIRISPEDLRNVMQRPLPEISEIGGQRLATFPWFDVVHDVRDCWIANYDSDSRWSKQNKMDLLKYLQTKEEPTIDLHEWEQILNKR